MPRKSSGYGRRYLRERKRLLAGKPQCCEAGCAEVGTTADHNPPLSRHIHREGSGCCMLRPMCVAHMVAQGGRLATRKRQGEPAPQPVFDADPDGYDVDHPVWDRATWLDALREVPADGWWPRLMTVP